MQDKKEDNNVHLQFSHQSAHVQLQKIAQKKMRNSFSLWFVLKGGGAWNRKPMMII